jgi:hypothetical protein
MNRKVSYKFETPRYSYGTIERALIAFFGLEADRAGPLRGRLKHLSQLGLGVKAGKGARVQYSFEQASQWLMALLLAELGIAPTVIAMLIRDQWKVMEKPVWRAAQYERTNDHPQYLVIRPRLMSGPWLFEGPWATLSYIGSFLQLDFSHSIAAKRPHPNVDMALGHPELGWSCIRNLTYDIRRFQEYLDSGLDVVKGEES